MITTTTITTTTTTSSLSSFFSHSNLHILPSSLSSNAQIKKTLCPFYSIPICFFSNAEERRSQTLSNTRAILACFPNIAAHPLQLACQCHRHNESVHCPFISLIRQRRNGFRACLRPRGCTMYSSLPFSTQTTYNNNYFIYFSLSVSLSVF